MNIYLVSIFPDIYESFLNCSLVGKAIAGGVLNVSLVNPRSFSKDRNQQIDDEIYGGGAGMLMKALPVIEAIESAISVISGDFRVVYMAPCDKILDQRICNEYKSVENLIIINGRYEGIDARFEQYLSDKYPGKYERISIGKYVLMGGEVASMVFIEAVTRLIDGVIKESESHEFDSYSLENDMKNIEYPQYTRPLDVLGYKVPEILLSGNHAKIAKWRKESESKLI